MSQDLDVLYDEPAKRPHGTLSFTKTPDEKSRTSEHIQSWQKVTPVMKVMGGGTSNGITLDNSETLVHPGLKFEVVSARTVEELGQRKHVAYTVRIRKDGDIPDPNPGVIERRYSDFLELYCALRQEYPALMARLSFPKKVLVGNFGPGVISERSSGFESLLEHAARDEHLHQSPHLATFLQGAEQKEARVLMEQKRFDLAVPLLENTFRLLNKIYTDRHPFVMTSLCRLVACCASDTAGEAKVGGRAERFAELALRRFEAVSDADLLCFYVPLLQLCVHLWWAHGKDKQPLTARLDDLKRRGIRVDGSPTLLDAIMELDK